ncbi:hypothetical protein [Novosphingobium sp. 9]|uniref:hypothetical protein n=1 Tax=Novosphingobium sp. 9 TaxID=2025349 RepID=UPI0021B6306A|nr:hypothetical protein [Novosphingobium sp. 9]
MTSWTRKPSKLQKDTVSGYRPALDRYSPRTFIGEVSLASLRKPPELRDRPGMFILDMVNCFDFEGADDLQPSALAAARNIHRLRGEFRDRQWPVIYVNDNFGDRHSEASILIWRSAFGSFQPDCRCLGN